MTISLKTHKMLWGRAANRCAICRMELVMDATETDDESVVGEACHIVAEKVEGPRGQSPLTQEQRDKYRNLILLCNVHHKQIDDQVATYTIEKLHKIKETHLTWVKAALNFDAQKQHDDEIYADYVEHWVDQLKLDEWQIWSSWLVSNGQPSISIEMLTSFETIRPWILSRIWPGRYKRLESAFNNFRYIVQDLSNTFSQNAVERSNSRLETKKFYQIDQWNPEVYNKLFAEFEEHVGLVEDLTLELTRAANYVCDMVRSEILPSFRLREGALLIQAGPYENFSYKTYRVEYRNDERTDAPYPGFLKFKEIRFTRDVYFGENKQSPNISNN